MVGHELTVFNLPQNIEGGIKIHGFTSPAINLPDDAVLLFSHTVDMYGRCTIEGDDDKTVVWVHGTTPLVELEGGEYQVNGEAQPHEEDEVPHESK